MLSDDESLSCTTLTAGVRRDRHHHTTLSEDIMHISVWRLDHFTGLQSCLYTDCQCDLLHFSLVFILIVGVAYYTSVLSLWIFTLQSCLCTVSVADYTSSVLSLYSQCG